MRSSMPSLQSVKFAEAGAPTADPISVSQAKRYANIDFDDRDEELQDLIRAAREWIEEYTQRALITETVVGVWALPRIPEGKTRGLYAELGQDLTFWLPRSPLQAVVSAEIETDLNTWQTLTETTDYVVDDASDPPRLWLRASAISYWYPAGALINFMGVQSPRVRITWRAGYGDDSSKVPYSFKRAINAAVATAFDNPGCPFPDELLNGLDAVLNV